MKSLLKCSVCFLMLMVMNAGCSDPEGGNGTKPKIEPEAHVHEEGDELFWKKKDIPFEGYLVALGHHGAHFHGGESIEPAIMLTKDGEDIGDAKTSCSLVDDDGNAIVQADMLFEPKTEDEPAHYAQGDLKFPVEEKPYKIEFTILVDGKEFKDSIEVTVGH